MKVKVIRILAIISVFIGGAFAAGSASAIVTHEAHSDVQFTFAPLLTLTLSSTLTDCPTPYENPTFCIEGLAPGTEALSNTVTATINTNSSAGYTLSAKVAGTSLDGNHTFSNTDLVSLSGHSDKFTMIDDTSSTSLSAGEWGFTLTGDAVAPATPTYMTLSDTTERIINATVDKSGTAATGYDGTNTTDMNIGAYADTAQKAGLYGNVINFTATSNIQMRTVTVAKNNNDVASVEINSVDGTPITPVTTGSWADGQALGISATCAANKTFLGWGISGDFGQITNQDLASTTYNVGGNNVTLTAYCGSEPIMQKVTADVCTAEPKTVIDSRDNQKYTIAKLTDGNCWMIDNLRLGYTADNAASTSYQTTFTLTPTDSNVAQDRTFTAYDLVEYGQSGEECYGETAGSGAGYNNPCIHSKDLTSGNNTIGVWYNYMTATAGTIYGSTNNTDASEDICPRGWRLPTNSDNQSLVSAIGSSLDSFNPVYGGYYYNSELRYPTSYGFWWSSTTYTAQSRYFMYYNSGSLTNNGSTRFHGLYVRCVLR